jgi:sec-independent protein translocase protein TatA
MTMPGFTELLMIFGIVVLLFGGSRLPKLGGAIGESIRNFKRGLKESDANANAALKEAPQAADTGKQLASSSETKS